MSTSTRRRRGLVGHPVGQQVEQLADVGHVLPVGDVRPVRAPHAAVGRGLVQGARDGDRVAIGRALARHAEGARELHPAAVAHQADQRLEARLLHAGGGREVAHVVDDERHRQARDGRRQGGELARIEQELQVPAELAAQRAVVGELVEADAAAVEHVEAQADHAGLLHGAPGLVRTGPAAPRRCP